MSAFAINHPPVFRSYGYGFQRAFEKRFVAELSLAVIDLHLCEDRFFQDFVVMSADPKAHIKRFAKYEFERTARRLQRFASAGDRHKDSTALFLDADSARIRNIGLNLSRRTALHFPVLQG